SFLYVCLHQAGLSAVSLRAAAAVGGRSPEHCPWTWISRGHLSPIGAVVGLPTDTSSCLSQTLRSWWSGSSLLRTSSTSHLKLLTFLHQNPKSSQRMPNFKIRGTRRGT
ncbi:unnamed protein product, partial [Timema podura]|nr:unnamed protein product [Timema podura]